MSNRKRVVGIVGSPRKGGNTDIMIDEILKGAEEAGAEIEKVMLTDFEIMPCKACDACRENGKCIQKDDLAELLGKLDASGVWVFGTPVYWWGPSAQLKALLDRWYSKTGTEELMEFFKGRRVILAAPMGDSNPKTGRHLVGMFEDAMAFIGSSLFGTLLAPGAYNKGDVKGHTEVMEEARRLGVGAVTKQ
jgi:multimeric flavodoxin WrbA